MKKSFITSFIFFTAFLMFSGSSFAVVIPGNENMPGRDGEVKITNNEAVKNRVGEVETGVKNRVEEKNVLISSRSANKLKQQKLTAAKLKVCENRKSNIKNRTSNTVNQADRMISVFENITQRVMQFYVKKRVPEGKTVNDYNQLISEIDVKKKAVNDELLKAVTVSDDFDCNGNDPIGQLTSFRNHTKNVITTLKEYRTAVRNLIVAVAGAGNVNKTSTGSVTITPTAQTTPVATIAP